MIKLIPIIVILFLSTTALSQNVRLLDGLGLNSEISKVESEYSCVAKSPSAPPSQFSGGEGVPPLPLPAVPLRRSEKKNPPRPPVLVVKIVSPSGERDWNTNPADIDNLLKFMAKEYNLNFSTVNMPIEEALRERHGPIRLVEKK